MLSKTITLKTMTALLLSFRSCSQRLVHTPTWINLYMRVNDCLTNKHSASSCVLTEQWTKNHRTIVSWSKNSSWFICPCVGPPSHLSPTSPEENIRIKDYKSLQWHLLGDQMGLTLQSPRSSLSKNWSPVWLQFLGGPSVQNFDKTYQNAMNRIGLFLVEDKSHDSQKATWHFEGRLSHCQGSLVLH